MQIPCPFGRAEVFYGIGGGHASLNNNTVLNFTGSRCASKQWCISHFSI